MGVLATDPAARDIGINNMRFWWNATPMANGAALADGTTPGFPDAIAYYDGLDPTIVSQIGAATSDIAQADIKTGFTGIADSDGNKYPLPNEFIGAIVQYAGATTTQIVIGAVTDTGKQVAAVAAGIGGAYLLGLLAVFLFESGALGSILKSKK